MSKFVDISGRKFARWSVLRMSDVRVAGKIMWECVCECGATGIVSGANLRRGLTSSCGCLRDELNGTHRMMKTPEYTAWTSMKNRCYFKGNARFENYGGRGIIVCERWRTSFENFYADMGKRPSPKHSLDRIDVNGNYEPGNCRWATWSVQQHNKRIARNNTSGVTGVTWDKNRSCWVAWMKGMGKRQYLGSSESLEGAAAIRRAAEREWAAQNIREAL